MAAPAVPWPLPCHASEEWCAATAALYIRAPPTLKRVGPNRYLSSPGTSSRSTTASMRRSTCRERAREGTQLSYSVLYSCSSDGALRYCTRAQAKEAMRSAWRRNYKSTVNGAGDHDLTVARAMSSCMKEP